MKSIAHQDFEELKQKAVSANKAYVMKTKKKGKKVIGIRKGGVYDIGMILGGGLCFSIQGDIGPAIKLPDNPLK